jgi:hypothetical protein
MAALAFLRAMLALQSEARLGSMIETLPVQSNQCKFRAAMFDMTARAIRLADGIFEGARMIARAGFHSDLDLDVTFEASETARSKIVAGCALSDARQLGVSARQRTRCNLRLRDTAAEHIQCRAPERNAHTPSHFSGNSKHVPVAWPCVQKVPRSLPIWCQ